ncbi:MAG TPA: hypothetical protein ENL16_03280 [Candidatus Woesearchaeota archaeon]|nr:hypothetical protein [Candidatus Woesearchaeota archaeon]
MVLYKSENLKLLNFLLILFLFILPITLLLSSELVRATVIGANKGVINFRNVLKNGYAQELVTLTTDTDFNLSVTYKVEGELADWVRVEPPQQPFFISKDKPNVVAIIVEPPGDAKNQHYTGSIRFLTGALAGPEGQFGTAVRAAINIRLGVDITGQEIVSCRAGGFQIEDVEEGYPLEFYALVTNNGNVRIKPEFILEFWNQDQSELVETFRFTINESILPTVQKRVFYSLEHDLDIGQYWVRIRTPLCGDAGSGFITVSVIERGGVSDKGELIRIENEPWVRVGDIVPIDAVFKNLGTRVVSAKFKGTISSGDEIFKIIDTDPLDVMPGEIVKLRTYFNPVQEGQYMIKGRVLYNKKLTFEKSSVLNVNPSGKPTPAKKIEWGGVLIILLVIIVILIILILRRKKRFTKHIKRVKI